MENKKAYVISKGENGLNYIDCFSVDGKIHVTKNGNSKTGSSIWNEDSLL